MRSTQRLFDGAGNDPKNHDHTTSGVYEQLPDDDTDNQTDKGDGERPERCRIDGYHRLISQGSPVAIH